MSQLECLKDTTSVSRKSKRVGRGIGTGKGKTCGRGQKGAGSRSGYKRRYGKEGGQFPLYMKLPTRGFTRGRFQKRLDSINLALIDKMFEDGEIVNIDTLTGKGLISGPSHGVKILGEGSISKKVIFEVHSVSKSAKEKIEESKLEIKLLK